MSEGLTDPPPGDSPRAPSPLRWLAIVAVLGAVGWLLVRLQGVLTPVFFALFIAYLLDPAVDVLEGRGLPRAAGIAVLLAGFLLGLFAVLLLVVPGVVREVGAFSAELPARAEKAAASLAAWLEARDLPVPRTLDELVAAVGADPGSLAERAAAPVATAFAWLAGGTASLVGTLTASLLVPVFAFYLLHDFDHITAVVRELLPHGVRKPVVAFAQQADEVIGHFIRGQLLVMAMLAVLYGVAYSLLGVRLALAIGLVGGLVSFIPYLGGALALGLAILMVLLHWQGWGQLVGVLVAYGAIQTLEGFYVTPKIVGDRVGLPAVWVLLALLAFGELFGFLGVLLAVPAAAVVKILVMSGLERYRRSELYGTPTMPPPPPDAPADDARGEAPPPAPSSGPGGD